MFLCDVIGCVFRSPPLPLLPEQKGWNRPARSRSPWSQCHAAHGSSPSIGATLHPPFLHCLRDGCDWGASTSLCYGLHRCLPSHFWQDSCQGQHCASAAHYLAGTHSSAELGAPSPHSWVKKHILVRSDNTYLNRWWPPWGLPHFRIPEHRSGQDVYGGAHFRRGGTSPWTWMLRSSNALVDQRPICSQARRMPSVLWPKNLRGPTIHLEKLKKRHTTLS